MRKFFLLVYIYLKLDDGAKSKAKDSLTTYFEMRFFVLPTLNAKRRSAAVRKYRPKKVKGGTPTRNEARQHNAVFDEL